jgi:hypothetical protein
VAISTAFDWQVQNIKDFQAALDRLGKQTSDFRIPFGLIGMDWYRSNRKLFTLSSAGLYQDLAPSQGQDGNPTTTSNYKAVKAARQGGNPYPILVGQTKKLSKSILSRTAEGAIFQIGKRELIMGTDISYATYHQSNKPRSKIPQRKIIFIDGGPADRSKDSSIAGRRERWLSIIDTHIQQLVTGRI